MSPSHENGARVTRRPLAALPQGAVEDTKRVMNLHLERAVLATLDFALTAEHRSFDSPELRADLDRLLPPEPPPATPDPRST